MRVRRVRVRDVEGVKPLDISCVGDMVLFGENGSGKSLVCRAIGDAFAPVLVRSAVSDLRGDFWVEFDIGSEVGVITISGGKVSRLQSMKRLVRVDGGVENAVLCYGSGRMTGDTGMGDGVRAIHSILHDLHVGNSRDCVVVIDDFELGLSFQSQRDLYAHLHRNLRSKGNQLIITTRSLPFVEWIERTAFGGVHCQEVPCGVNVVAAAMKGLVLRGK